MKFKGYMPDYIFEKTSNITPQFLSQNNINCLFLDADGTLGRHKKLEAADGVMDWIDLMHKNGVKLIITSNNFKKRVSAFAALVNLPYVCFSLLEEHRQQAVYFESVHLVSVQDDGYSCHKIY